MERKEVANHHGQSWFNYSAVPYRGGISVLELRLDGFASLHSKNQWQPCVNVTTTLPRGIHCDTISLVPISLSLLSLEPVWLQQSS